MAKAARSVRVIVPPLAIVLTLRPGAVDRERKSDGETRQGVATRSVRTISRLAVASHGGVTPSRPSRAEAGCEMVSRAEARRRLTTPRGSLYIRLGDID